METKINNVDVRGVWLALIADNRSLDLCSRMNYETENLDFIDNIPEGSVYFDLGACEGRFSIYAAKKGLNVFCFEPEENNFKVLQSNIEINRVSNKISAFNIAVGDGDKDVTLGIGQPWAGGHQKVVQHDGIRNDLSFDVLDRQKVKMFSLDSCIKLNKLPTPNYLKVDVDGSEILFLEGAKSTLQNPALTGIIFELCETDKNFRSIVEQLESYNFTESGKFQIPNEPDLYNFVFTRSQ